MGATAATAGRRLATDPITPALAFGAAALLAVAARSQPLAWASLAGLAGYSLSGSV